MEPLRVEWESFIATIGGAAAAEGDAGATGEDALRTLRLAEALARAARERAVIELGATTH